MQAERQRRIALEGIHRQEPPVLRAVVARAQVVRVETAIELLAGEQKVIDRRAGGRCQIAEGVIGVGIGRRAAGIRQDASAVQTVVVVVGGRGASELAQQVGGAVRIGRGELAGRWTPGTTWTSNSLSAYLSASVA